MPIEQAWLFGSRARGDALEDSDWDLLVVSGAFRGVPYLKRLQTLYRLPLRRAEYVALTPEELEARRNEIGIVGEALREGIRLL
ncbi:nucleotidyltransferase domain-containing protein [Allomeiothermus silvanus]|uniref:nucleotidyltransferase domain-containing protein n=1 Tax=Allomeiothermus silvanus TaxID=52022 RepID=UPI0023F1A997|nr:nucleotidyltransferase domain-containing protein [Allomeiothermus silvanus]